MKLKWLGHSAFLLTAADGTRIITDPYKPGAFDGAVGYKPITEACNAVTVSHDHDDHGWYRGLPGNPKLIRGSGSFTVGPVAITGFDTAHDGAGGTERGRNTVYRFALDGLTLLHCGDLGEDLSQSTIKAVGAVDILLVPVGGHFTIDASQARALRTALAARITVPMHYKTAKLGFPIAGVEAFLADLPGVRHTGVAEVEITADTLPASPEVWVLEHAL